MSFNYQNRSKELLVALNDAHDKGAPPTLITVLRERLASCIDRDWMKYLTATERHLNFANLQMSSLQGTLYSLLQKSRHIKGLNLAFEIDWEDAAAHEAIQARLVSLDRHTKIKYLKYAGYKEADIILRDSDWLDGTLWAQVVSRGHLPTPEQVHTDIGRVYKANAADIAYVYNNTYDEDEDEDTMRDKVIEWMLREKIVPDTFLPRSTGPGVKTA